MVSFTTEFDVTQKAFIGGACSGNIAEAGAIAPLKKSHFTECMPVQRLWHDLTCAQYPAVATRGVHVCGDPVVLVNAGAPKPTINPYYEFNNMWYGRTSLEEVHPETRRIWEGEGEFKYGHLGPQFREWWWDVRDLMEKWTSRLNGYRISRHTPRLDWPRMQGICWQSWELVWKGQTPQLVGVARSTDAYFGLAADLATLKWLAMQISPECVPVMVCLRPHLYVDQIPAVKHLLGNRKLASRETVGWYYEGEVADDRGWRKIRREPMVEEVPEPLRPKVATR